MAQRLAGGNLAIALLANTAATVAVLYTLISLLGPISGAHFNPAVSALEALRGRLSWRDAGAYAAIQILGCCGGALLAPLMFELPVWQLSTHVRSGPAQALAEAIATFGLLLVVIGHRRAEEAPWMVACWIGAAYWFTASTSFVKPRDHDRALADRYVLWHSTDRRAGIYCRSAHRCNRGLGCGTRVISCLLRCHFETLSKLSMYQRMSSASVGAP